MRRDTTRRRFLQASAAGGALLGLGEWGLGRLPRVSAAEAQVDPKLVRLDAGIEPLVRLLETTPQDKLLDAVAGKIRGGTSYQEILAALLLAAVRNVQPRPAVGFKFHAVLVINSCHLASLAAADNERWLPIFWALDYFKRVQREEEQASGWKMGPVDDSALPAPDKARAAFIQAMDRWDEPAADAAVAALARSAGANEVFELFCRYGARDFRSIGHKAIFVANAFRTLQTIGWQHAEPVLRSLAYALLNHNGEPNPADNDLGPDRPGRRNQDLVKTIRPDWRTGKVDDGATREMLAVLHGGSNDEACDLAVKLINGGTAAQSVWDAVLVGGGELLMRQPGIVGLHSLTTGNALHYAWQHAADDQTRLMMLLQNCAFVPMFRQSAAGRGKLRDRSVQDMTPTEPAGDGSPVEQILADISGNRDRAAAEVLSYLQEGGPATALIDAARRQIFIKGRDAHDYKFSSAVLEDFDHVSPAWRDRFLALSVYNLRGTGGRDSDLPHRTREAFKA